MTFNPHKRLPKPKPPTSETIVPASDGAHDPSAIRKVNEALEKIWRERPLRPPGKARA